MPQVEATTDDALLVEHYRLHWLDMGLAPAEIREDWAAEAFRFLRDARAGGSFAAFVAKEADTPIGSACCQLTPRRFPVFGIADAPRIGYLWGVYVRPGFRGRGIGTALVKACTDHLRSIGCGRVMLHAADRSAPLYGRLGFVPTEELAAPL